MPSLMAWASKPAQTAADRETCDEQATHKKGSQSAVRSPTERTTKSLGDATEVPATAVVPGRCLARTLMPDVSELTTGRSLTRDSKGSSATNPRRMRDARDPQSPETTYRIAAQEYLSAPANIHAVALRTARSASPRRSKWCSPEQREDEIFSDQEVSGGDGTGGFDGTRANRGQNKGEKDRIQLLSLKPAGWGVNASGEWTSLESIRAVRGVGRVPLTWTDRRGSTLLHLAAQHNDVSLFKAVLDCERRRESALQVRNERRARVLDRATQWTQRNLRNGEAIATATKSPTSREIRRRIKAQQREDKSAAREIVTASAADDDAGDDMKAGNHAKASRSDAPPYVDACRRWMSLNDGGGHEGCGEEGRVVVDRLKELLEADNLRKVLRLAGMYFTEKLNEADWYHRTAALLPSEECRELLIAIADAHPSDTWELRLAKEAIQDYAEEERSGPGGNYWMDRAIQAALDLNARNCLGETPLILGTQQGSLEVVVALLLEAGTDITAANADGCTALIISAMLDKHAVAKTLIAACRARAVGVDQQTANGYSALHWAAVRGNADLVLDLVDAGAAVNEGRTERELAFWRLPIHKCAEYGSTSCLNILLKAGADPLLEDKLGMTAMHIAASKGFVEIMRLLSSGEYCAVAVNIPSKKNGKLPLHFAVECLQVETARFVLANSPVGDDGERKLLDGTQRSKLETMLAAAEKEERGFVASAAATFSEFVRKVF